MPSRSPVLRVLSFLLLSGCALSSHPEELATLDRPAPATWDDVIADAGPIEHEVVVSARWQVALKGLVDLKDPAAKAAGLKNEKVGIVLPVHVLRHPDKGVFVIDTGLYEGFETRERKIVKGLLRSVIGGIEVGESLAEILARQPAPLAGVLITHMHIDHVLGLPDIADDVPVWIGPGEQHTKSLQNGLLHPTYGRLLDGNGPLQMWDYGPAPEPIQGAVDLLGDGSIWALETPGHTAGSTSYLVNTTEGPVLFTGDTSHTLWGWEHGVPPGKFTEDHDGNAVALAQLKALVDAHPEIRVFVGHETDGEGTGVE